jgi:uncharacterized protein (DUF433 family)
MPKKFREFITIDPNIKSGTPVISGTRVSVAEILDLFEQEQFIEKVISNLDDEDIKVSREAIFAAIEYAKYTSMNETKTRKKSK